ncbi:MAG: hypothetical protein ACEQSF_03015 [Solirubrobacteraceae bacterium]
MDVFKTVAGTIGKEVPNNIAKDGVNLLPFISSKQNLEIPHKTLFWRIDYVKYVRKSNWKLHINTKEGFTRLHYLKNDPIEKKDLSKVYPEKVKELKLELANWEKNLKKPSWLNIVDAKVEDGLGNRYFFPW